MKGNDYVFATVCIVLFLAVGGCYANKDRQKTITEFKREAVSLGHAEWVADNEGNVEFKWKEESK